MKRILTFAMSAAAVAALTMSAPALAKSKKHTYRHHDYEQSYSHGPHYGWGGWNSRNVSADPSFGNRAGINKARRTGRCVEDLGYGRWDYCGG